MNRDATVALRRFVDDAVGRHYDAVFARLDALVVRRCRCRPCQERLLAHCARLVAELPPVRTPPPPVARR